ncbi:MAG: four helix bundle protein [Acidobacteriota bacterium]
MDGAPDDPGNGYPLPAIDGWSVAEAESNPVREKSFDFALEIIKLGRSLVESKEFVISRQLMRSGTAVGALVEEAIGAESRRDFLHKMSMAHKEARETHYWLRLLDASDLLPGVEMTGHMANIDELVRLLTAITRSVKESLTQ